MAWGSVFIFPSTIPLSINLVSMFLLNFLLKQSVVLLSYRPHSSSSVYNQAVKELNEWISLMLVWFDIWWEGNSLLSMAWLCGDAAVKFDKRDEPRATALYLTTSAYSGIARKNDLPHMKRIAYTNQSKVRSINLLRGCVIYSWRTLCASDHCRTMEMSWFLVLAATRVSM